MTKQTVSRKEKEKLARKQLILDAAMKVFSEKGYSASSLDEIAQKAEFSKAALYLYFKSKEELFCELIDSKLEIFNENIRLQFKNIKDPMEKLKTLIEIFLKFHKNHDFRRIESKIISEIDRDTQNRLRKTLMEKYKAYIETVSGVMQSGIEKKYFRYGNKTLLAHVFIGLVQSIMNKHMFESRSDKVLEEELNLVFEIFLKGVGK